MARHFSIRMSQHFSNILYRYTIGKHQGRKCVPGVMKKTQEKGYTQIVILQWVTVLKLVYLLRFRKFVKLESKQILDILQLLSR